MLEFSRVNRFLYSIISMYPPAGSSIETLSEAVNRVILHWDQLSYEASFSVVHG